MAVTNLGRPRNGAFRDTEVVGIPVPGWYKRTLMQEARAAGCRSLAEYVRTAMGVAGRESEDGTAAEAGSTDIKSAHSRPQFSQT